MELTNIDVNTARIRPACKFVPSTVPAGYVQPEPSQSNKPSGRSNATFIDGYEGFIDQTKYLFMSKNRVDVSENSMSLAPTVTREEYDSVLRELNQQPTVDNRYKDGLDDALEIKKKLYPQYAFELMQNFSLLFYGYGSKRNFLKELCEQYLSFNLNTSDELPLPFRRKRKRRFSDGDESGEDEEDEILENDSDDSDIDIGEEEGIPVLHVNGYNMQLNHRDIFAAVMEYIKIDDEELVFVLEEYAKQLAKKNGDEEEDSDLDSDMDDEDLDQTGLGKEKNIEIKQQGNAENEILDDEALRKKKKSSGESKLWGNSIHYELNNLIKYYNITNSGFGKRFKLILCMHSFDGPQAHRPKFIIFLTLLAQINCIAFVCSMDHIKSPMLYDHNSNVAFNFVYHDATNYRFYSLEHSFQYDSFQTVYHDTQYVTPSSATEMTSGSKKTIDSNNTMTGVKYVLDSLTLNSKKMYKLLLETILARKELYSGRFNKAYRIEFKPFFDQCQHEFIASNEMALRNMLREYIEHRMAAIAKNKRTGVETIDVPYSELEISLILKEHLHDV